ncbi:MAG: hypothetical protein Q4A66_13330, partial [Eubacteriales bacterium]|nr:hypothetical protein [Eubacteriales bacterium]
LLCALLCAAFLRPAPAPVEPVSFDSARDILTAALDYDAGTRTLRGKQTMTLTNRSDAPRGEIVLRAYMNAFDEDAVAITDVRVDGRSVRFSWDDGDRTTLRIEESWAAGRTLELSFTLMIKHAKTDGAAVVTLPQTAMHEEGAWRTDAYTGLEDAGYAQPFDFAVHVDGEIAVQMESARDASFVLGGIRREKTIGGVRVTAVSGSGGDARQLLGGAKDALASLEAAGFAYPFETLTIVRAHTGLPDGAAYSGMIVLPDEADGEENLRRMTRLIAGETFGVLVESDPWNAPWLSVSLASCAEMLAFRERKGAAAYETRFFEELEPATRLTRPAGVCVGAGTAHFGSGGEMTQVLRDQGAVMLLGIEQAAGSDAFAAAIKAYIAACAGQTGTRAALERALLHATGSSWSGYLTDMLLQ